LPKIRGIIDRFEEDLAVVRANGKDIIIPKQFLPDLKEGDSVTIVVSNENEATEHSANEAQTLVADLFKEE
jgi:hypothetical protein